MSSVAALGTTLAYTEMAETQIDMNSKLMEIAYESSNEMVSMLDEVLQQSMDMMDASAEGMGGSVDVKA